MAKSRRSGKAAKGGNRAPRGVTFAGLLFLCVCFFLPQIRSCGSPVIPASETYQEGPGWLLVWGLPFVFAFLAAMLYGLWYLIRKAGPRAVLMRLTCGWAILVLGWGCIQMARLVTETSDVTPLVLLILLCGAAIGSCIFAVSMPSRAKGPICVFIFALASGGYFLYWPVMTNAKIYYGLWCSVSASVLMAIGGLWEALVARSK